MQASSRDTTMNVDHLKDSNLEGVLFAMKCLADYIELMEALNRQIDRIRKDCFDVDAQRQKAYHKLLVCVGKLQNKRSKMSEAEVKETLDQSRFMVEEFLSLSDSKMKQFQILQGVIRHRDYQREHGYRFAIDHLEMELRSLYPKGSKESRPPKRYKSPTRFPKQSEIPPDEDDEEEVKKDKPKESTSEETKTKLETAKAVARARKSSGSWRLLQWFCHSNGVKKDRLYCTCQQKWSKRMIACSNGPDCSIEWFHLECVDLLKKPEVEWYCTQCCNPPKALTFHQHNRKVKVK